MFSHYYVNHCSRFTNGFLILAFLVLGLFSSLASGSGFSGLFNKEKQTGTTTDFLKVDDAFVFNSKVMPNGLQLNWKIAPEYYLYLERFSFKASYSETIIGPPRYSTTGVAKEDDYFGMVHVIHDSLEVFLPVQLAEGVTEDEITISYQGCAEAGLCYPPKNQNLLFTATNDSTSKIPELLLKTVAPSTNSMQLDLDDATGVFAFIQESSLLWIVIIFFLLGLGLTFTPCVFPMIPIISSIVAGQQHPSTARALILSISYVLGMALTYAAAGVLTGLLGAGANIQAALQNPYLLTAFAGIFIILALSMFGLYELQLPSFIRQRLTSTNQKLSGGHVTSVFLIGALSAVVVSPCVSAPLAGALLYISATADAVIGGLSLFALGLGMGVPLIIIAVTGNRFLPKSGHWMNQVKYIFGILLIAVAIWLLSRVLPTTASMFLWSALIGLSAIQMGAFDTAKAGWPRIRKGLGLFMALYAATLFIGALSGADDPLKPLDKFTPNAYGQISSNKLERVQFTKIYDMPALEAQLAIARENNQPLLLDFYADWCISCIVMEKNIFPLPEIKSKLAQFHLVKADVTQNSADNQALMNNFGLFGPPSILLFDTSGNELKAFRIVGEISKNAFEQRLIRALENEGFDLSAI